MSVPPYLIRYRERRARAHESNGAGEPLYRRPLSSRPQGDGAWRPPTSSPEIVASPVTSDGGDGLVHVHLVRHGETQSYVADAGLTPRGEWQSRRFGSTLAADVRDGETVQLLCAPTARAARTADQVRVGLEDGLAAHGREASVLGPEPAQEFRNFQIWTPDGLRDPTAASGEYRLAPGRLRKPETGVHALWQLELLRFWALQQGGGDAIEFWLTMPLLTFEPPVAVVRRFWTGAAQRAAAANGHTRVVCCTHSGPMRAFATWALGHDAGEPNNTEEVRVRLWPDLSRAAVTYRGRTHDVSPPPGPAGFGRWEPAAGAQPAS
jgi:broad specificity phosphatase PhoE